LVKRDDVLKKSEIVDFRSPIYLQLREVIREKIEEGEYPAGSAIPSENELAAKYGVNRITVRNAIDCLVEEGLLKSIQGKGNYVLYGGDGCLEQNLDSLRGFTHLMDESRMTAKILKKTVRLADEKFSAIFGIAPEDPIHYIKRICCSDGEPFSLEEIFIPKAVVPSLANVDLSVFSQYEIYESLGIGIKRAVQTLDIVQLDLQEANLLDLTDKPNVFLLTTTSYDQNGRPLEFIQAHQRGDKLIFDVHYTA